MKLCFYSHSTYSIECKGKYLIIDPFFTGNPMFLKEPNFVKEYIKNFKIDYILVTHAHFDHIKDVEFIAKNTGATIISNYEISNYFSKKGILNTLGMNFGGMKSFDFGTIKYIWATHSSVFPNGIYGGQPGGFLLNSENKTIYIAGDTSLNQEMKLIPLFAKINLAILPIGGLFTMDVNDAIIASEFIKCNQILGVHYDTFESIKINHDIAIEKFLIKKKNLILLKKNYQINI